MTNNPTQSRPIADLQGLRDALLAAHPAHRDPSGWLAHPAFPVFDEDVNTRLLLKAFGLETAFVLMSNECDIDDTEACEGNCSAWTPTPPDGEDWALTEIYDTEDGPCALFVRESKIARSRRRPAGAGLDAQAEWRAAAAVYDHFEVDNALRALIADPTDYNATCAVRSVLRLAATDSDALVFKMECFIDHATGGRLSKSSWALETLKAAHDEYLKWRVDESISEVVPAPAQAETQPEGETAHVSWAWLRGVICDLPSTPSGYRRLIALHDVLAWIDEAELRAILATAKQAGAQATTGGYEHYAAIREGHRNAAEAAWLSTLTKIEPRRAFQTGFDAGYNTRDTIAAPTWAGAAEPNAKEDAHVIDRLGKLLADVAIALKGEELPLHLHSYHDLPDVARVMKLELDLYRATFPNGVPESAIAAPVQDARAPSMVGDAKGGA